MPAGAGGDRDVLGADLVSARGEEPVAVGAAEALSRLEELVSLLEQFAHPSNTGGWSSDLATFLRQVRLVLWGFCDPVIVAGQGIKSDEAPRNDTGLADRSNRLGGLSTDAMSSSSHSCLFKSATLSLTVLLT